MGSGGDRLTAIIVVVVVVVIVRDLLIASPGWGRGSTTDSATSKVGGVGRRYGCWVAHLASCGPRSSCSAKEDTR